MKLYEVRYKVNGTNGEDQGRGIANIVAPNMPSAELVFSELSNPAFYSIISTREVCQIHAIAGTATIIKSLTGTARS